MNSDQLVIKIFLISSLLLIAFIIIRPGRGARGQAIRRLAWLFGLFAAVIAVLFPHTTDIVAGWLGVGRGTDLILYMAIVFFLGYAVTTSAHDRNSDRTITVLARKIALLEAELEKNNVLNSKN